MTTHYLLVSANGCTSDGTFFKKDFTVQLNPNRNLAWLRNAVKENMEQDFNVSLVGVYFESMSEISESLYHHLTGEQQENKEQENG